jgi:APA family basic amino acid/polyamine antiporter
MLTLSDGTVIDGGYINLPAIFIVSMLSLLLIRGTQESASNNFLVVLKVAVVLVFIILGWNFIDTANYTPYIPENTGVLRV